MKRFIGTTATTMLVYILPLLGNPQAIVDIKILVLFGAACAIFLTQPPLSVKEAREKKGTDRNSVYAIIVAGLLSLVVALLEWSYVHPILGIVENRLVVAGGFALIVGGIVFRVWSIQTLGKFFTSTVQVQDGQRVIKSGPYAVLRHPSYTGAFAAIIGATIFLQAPFAALVAVIGMSFAYKLRIAAEEETMVKEFGDEYRLYQQHTYRLIPMVW